MKWTDVDLAYLSGFVDGEGSITIFRSGRRDHLRFDVYNTNQDILLWIKEKFGGRVHKIRMRDGWKTEYVWQAGHQHGAEILTSCLPFLKIKRLQAEIFIAYAATSIGRAGKPIPAEVIPVRLAMVTEIQRLNKRGTK